LGAALPHDCAKATNVDGEIISGKEKKIRTTKRILKDKNWGTNKKKGTSK